jgi:hypothetical protein
MDIQYRWAHPRAHRYVTWKFSWHNGARAAPAREATGGIE